MKTTIARIAGLIFPWVEATIPAANRSESPGKKKPSNTPVSIKMIAPTTK